MTTDTDREPARDDAALTDEQIRQIAIETAAEGLDGEWEVTFARAVIAALAAKAPAEPARDDAALREAITAIVNREIPDGTRTVDGVVRKLQEIAALAKHSSQEPTITRRELAFALNYHSDDSRIGDADWKIAERYFALIESERGKHPSLGGPDPFAKHSSQQGGEQT